MAPWNEPKYQFLTENTSISILACDVDTGDETYSRVVDMWHENDEITYAPYRPDDSANR